MCITCYKNEKYAGLSTTWFKRRLYLLSAFIILFLCFCVSVLSDSKTNHRSFQRHIESPNVTTSDDHFLNRRLYKLFKRRRLRAVNFMQKKQLKSRVPEELLKQVLKYSEDKEEEEKKNFAREVKKKLIIRAKKADSSCSHCFYFFREIPSIYNVLKKADLWLHVKSSSKTRRVSQKKHSTIIVHKVNKKGIDGGKKTVLGQIKVRRNSHRWYNIVLKKVRDMITISPKGGMNIDLRVQLECVNCDFKVLNKDTKAFIGLTAEGKITPPPMTQRCQPGQLTCCLDDFHINLADYLKPKVGNIILPNKINVGICRGNCRDIHAVVGPHSAMINAMKLGQKKDTQKNLCCVPKRYKSFSAIIDDSNNHFIVKVIHDLVVSECTCA